MRVAVPATKSLFHLPETNWFNICLMIFLFKTFFWHHNLCNLIDSRRTLWELRSFCNTATQPYRIKLQEAKQQVCKVTNFISDYFAGDFFWSFFFFFFSQNQNVVFHDIHMLKLIPIWFWITLCGKANQITAIWSQSGRFSDYKVTSSI